MRHHPSLPLQAVSVVPYLPYSHYMLPLHFSSGEHSKVVNKRGTGRMKKKKKQERERT